MTTVPPISQVRMYSTCVPASYSAQKRVIQWPALTVLPRTVSRLCGIWRARRVVFLGHTKCSLLKFCSSNAGMAAALIRQSVLLKPTLSVGLNYRVREHRNVSKFFSNPSCSLHTVVATEDRSGERYKHTITSGPHTFRGDLSEAWGAGGTAPEPKDYAFAGLAMCSSMTIRLFADRKKWPLRRVQVTVKEIGKNIAGSIPDALEVIVSLEGNLTDAQKNRLIEISANCPVKQMMLGKIRNGISVYLSAA